MVDYPTPTPDSPIPGTKPQTDSEMGGFEDAKWLFVGGSIVGTLLIGFISAYQWLSPAMPVFLAIGMGVLLSGLIAFLLCERERGPAFAKGLGIWVLFALPTVLWAIGPVRAAVADVFGQSLTPPAQAAALQDPGESVRLSACVALGIGNQGSTARTIMANLVDMPELGAQCIQDVAVHDSPGASQLATAFVGQWHAALRRQEDAAICAGSAQLLHMSALTVSQPAFDLTECAATYSSDDVSVCCADALVAHYADATVYTGALGSPDELPASRRANLFRALVPYAFVRLDAGRRPLPSFESNLMNTPPGRTWVLELGCGGLLGGGGEEYVEAFEAIMSTQSCESGVRPGPSISTWKQICVTWSEQPERSADLCPAVASDAKEQAILTASARVHDAIRALFSDETTRQIFAGSQSLAKYRVSMEATGQMMVDAMNRRTPGNIGRSPELNRMASEIAANYPGALQMYEEYAPGATLEGGSPSNKKSARSLQGKAGEWWKTANPTPAQQKALGDIAREALR